MGQYYVYADANSRQGFSPRGGSKLMEHSYIHNSGAALLYATLASPRFAEKIIKEADAVYADAVGFMVGKKPVHVGDYSIDNEGLYLSYEPLVNDDEELRKGLADVVHNGPPLYVVNETKGVYLDIRDNRLYAAYKGRIKGHWLIVDPLSLLLADQGEGGGGDYRSGYINHELVGSWIGDYVYVTNSLDDIKEGIKKEVIIFIEGDDAQKEAESVKAFFDAVSKGMKV